MSANEVIKDKRILKNTELDDKDSFRNRMSNTDEKGRYKHVYATKPSGKYYTARNILSWVYLGIFLAMPFIKVNGMPLLQINVFEGRFIIFGKIFWPQDFFVFAVAMVAAVVFIALFTVIYGRLFCGWVCPQTVFMEMYFRKIEWLIDGNPAAQKRLKEAPWTGKKIFKRVLKHTIFFIFSFIIANTILAYIFGVDELFSMMKHPGENIGLLTGTIIFTFLFYAVFAFVRDVVCTTICPYGRLQSVLFDKDTMLVAYDYKRGEPRGKAKQKEALNLGDCVDCNKCVTVCPTGIDIRNGVQMECVGCTACIDACDEIMAKLNRPLGLIRYASENEIETGKKMKFIRPKAIGYSIILLLLVGLMSFLIVTGKSIDTNITRVAGQTYTEQANGNITNLYKAKVINKTNKELPYTFKLENINGEIIKVGNDGDVLQPETLHEINFLVNIPKDNIHDRKTEIKIGVYSGDEKVQTIKTSFLGPFKY